MQCFFYCFDAPDGNDDVSHGRDDEGRKRRLGKGSFLSTREIKDIVSQSLILLRRLFFWHLGMSRYVKVSWVMTNMNTWNLKHFETSHPLGHKAWIFLWVFWMEFWAEEKPGSKGGSKGPTGPQYGQKGGRSSNHGSNVLDAVGCWSIHVGERVCNRTKPKRVRSCTGFSCLHFRI